MMATFWATALCIATICYSAIAAAWFFKYATEEEGKDERCRAPLFKKGFLSVDLRSFDEKRTRAHFAYVRALVNRKPDPDSPSYKLLKGTRDGILTIYDRRKLKKEIQEQTNREFGFFAQFKLCARDEQCFFYPVRVIAAFFASLYAIGVMSLIFQESAVRTEGNLVQVYTWIQEGLVYAGTVATRYNETTGDDLMADSYRYRTAKSLAESYLPHIESLVYAIKGASSVANLCGVITFIVCWVTLFADFRSQALQMRRGIYAFDPVELNIKFRHAFAFFGTSMSNSLVSFFIIYFIIGLIFLILLWSATRLLLAYFIYTFRVAIVTLTVSYVGNYALTFCLSFHIGRSRVIKRRYAWMVFDFLQLFAQSVSGLTTAIVRALLALCALIVSLPRHDRSADPAWVDSIYVFDSLAKAYYATLLIYHHHNNPVVNVFAAMIATDMERRAEGTTGYLPADSRKLRMRNRWRKATLMLLNPDIRKFSAFGAEAEKEPEKKRSRFFLVKKTVDSTPPQSVDVNELAPSKGDTVSQQV